MISSIWKENRRKLDQTSFLRGGSLIPELTSLVAEKLQIPENRVAIGGQSYRKNIDLGEIQLTGPEFVTPIGIGITATLQKGYEFSQVTLNGNKFRIFDTKSVTAADLLMNAGFQTPQIIGKSGRGLIFNLNGEKQSLRGETSFPAQIMVNGLPAALEYTVKPGDVIDFTPATIGANAAVTVSDIAGEIFSKKIIIDGEEYTYGRTVRVNGAIVTGSYSVQNYDNIEIESIENLGDLIMSLPYDCSGSAFFKNDRLVRDDYVLEENDAFVTRDRRSYSDSQPNAARDIALKDEKASRTVETLSGITPAPEPAPVKAEAPAAETGSITVILNGKPTHLDPRTDNSPHEFIELMALADIDISDPPPSGNMILTLNGQNASFMDLLHEGDSVVIKWEM